MVRIDLAGYFRRIGYDGSGAPTLETLRELHYCHATSIPFENLSPLLRAPVPLDIDSLQRKLVQEGRGGYCFEHNLLFRHVLEELGFRVAGLAAGVVWNMPPGEMTARTHHLLKIDLDCENYLADVGFGGQTLTGPLRFVLDIEQDTPHEQYRLIAQGDEILLQVRIRDGWRPVYLFGMLEQRFLDCEVGNWYVSTHPQSLFVNHLLVARPAEGLRYAMFNNALSIHHLHGPSEQRTLTSITELRRALVDLFQIQLPADDEVDKVLERALAATAGSALDSDDGGPRHARGASQSANKCPEMS